MSAGVVTDRVNGVRGPGSGPEPVGGLGLDPVEVAVAQIAAGRPVVVVDDEDRENEGDLVFAATLATPELMGFMVRHSSGYVCAPMTGADLDRLNLPPMTAVNEDSKGTAYAVSVDARTGISTGISAADRAHTVRVLADPATTAADLRRPGHVLPLRAVPGGVLERPGHTEAAVDLCRLAGLPPVGVIGELVHDDGSMRRLPSLVRFAREHHLAIISIEALVAYRRRTERLVERVAATRLPSAHGRFTAVGFRSTVDGVEHVALVAGEPTAEGRVPGDGRDVLVRVHSECLTGDVFSSLRCDCGPQLRWAMERVAAEGGVLVYLRGHEGRGIGLLPKLRAYALQDQGHDTVDANLELGLPADARDFGTAGQILAELGVRSVRLLTNNPEKVVGLEAMGVTVTERIPVPPATNPDNLRYLRTKRDRMGHDLPGLDADVVGTELTGRGA